MWSHEAAPFGFTTLARIQNGMSVALLDMLVGGDAAQSPHEDYGPRVRNLAVRVKDLAERNDLAIRAATRKGAE
jgi:hypothetical protein